MLISKDHLQASAVLTAAYTTVGAAVAWGTRHVNAIPTQSVAVAVGLGVIQALATGVLATQLTNREMNCKKPVLFERLLAVVPAAFSSAVLLAPKLATQLEVRITIPAAIAFSALNTVILIVIERATDGKSGSGS